jgi:hypothetical protein
MTSPCSWQSPGCGSRKSVDQQLGDAEDVGVIDRRLVRHLTGLRTDGGSGGVVLGAGPKRLSVWRLSS